MEPAGLCFIVAAESKWDVAQTTAVIQVTGELSCRVRMQLPRASRRGWGRQLGWEGEADHSRQSLENDTIQAGGEEEMLMTGTSRDPGAAGDPGGKDVGEDVGKVKYKMAHGDG